MDIVLINPPVPPSYLGRISKPVIPLGLAYLASSLREEGISVGIIDLTLNNMDNDELITTLNSLNPSCIGITSLIFNFEWALNIAKKVKYDLNIPIILGGKYFTLNFDEIIKKYPFVDYILLGEAEKTLPMLIKNLKQNRNLKKIPDLVFNEGGRIIKTKMTSPPDLDKLPYPAYDLFNIEKYGLFFNPQPSIPMAFSRGCSHECNFCISPMFYKNYRQRDPYKVVDEIIYLKNKYKIKGIFFVDDDFLHNPKVIDIFCDILLQKKIKIEFFIQARADDIANNQQLIRKLKKVGLSVVLVGAENPSKDILDRYDKDLEIRNIIKSFKILNDNNIFCWASFIVGDKEESEKSIQYLYNFIEKTNPTVAVFQNFFPVPGSEEFKRYKKEKLFLDKPFTEWNYEHQIVKNKINQNEYQHLIDKTLLRYHMKPKRILRILTLTAGRRFLYYRLKMIFKKYK